MVYKMKLDLCVFDMDGLLIDTEKKMWTKNQMAAMEIMGGTYDKELFRSMMGCKFTVGYQKLVEFYGPDFDAEEFYRIVFDLNEKQINKGDIPIMPGAIELLEFLKTNNIERTIATSTSEELASKIIQKIGFNKYFDVVTYGTEVEKSKPEPDIYIKAISKYNVLPENTLVFEDAHSGAQAAIRANTNLILVPDVAPVTDEDRQKAYAVINSLDQAIDIIKKII